MSYLQVKGFGKLTLATATSSIHQFPTQHVEALLGYLLLNQHRTHSRDLLIELLWPHNHFENSRGRLSTVIWRLRCLFQKLDFPEHVFLRATREYVTFSPQIPLDFDVACFEKQMALACTASKDGAKFRALTTAVGLCQGDLYAGIDADWCMAERDRLANKRLHAIYELMQCHIRQQAYSEAIDLGRSILEADPLREEVHRALMYCYGRLGQRAQVAAQFQKCADDLLLELQVLPMSDTVQLYQQIMASQVEQDLIGCDQSLVERAHCAFAEFQKAGKTLHATLCALEDTSPQW